MKYLGGKQRLGKVIGPILREIWTTGQSAALSHTLILMQTQTQTQTHTHTPTHTAYVEPFCGSLGVLRVVADTFPPSATILASDYHPDLIQMWREVQAGTFEYPTAETCTTEEDYLRIKATKLPSGDPIALKAFIGFGLGFGGRYFASFAPKYANGKKEDFLGEMTHSVKAVQAILHKSADAPTVTFQCLDYRNTAAAAESHLKLQNCLVYCDPPYRSTKFPIKYRRDVKRYDDFDSDEFWERMREWSTRHTVLISEMSAPEDFVEVWSMQRYRSACQSVKTRFKCSDDAAAPKTEEYKNEKLFVHKSRLYC
jgi:site-specific DNA-adenine methylase